ncbi:intracellular sulfur oxidation DsrE/DsrF family protein [Lutibacter oceani]|uniref:Intracellular sulfur oxidation DsrE/DsrF family protein n=1 Tax=Lutibacter oceani TaxID=1853311 RepID=A0A3D9RPE6_9FLAO|nr:DsrE family protein [Lutibacter oceani]REE81789.1 intracellular sulfur oxidation DsrE/DsrF family protein [Lutibacter oceani]
MKKYIVVFLVFTCFSNMNSQIIKDFGDVFEVENPELLLAENTEYKVIFDIYTDYSNGEKINPLLNTVARFINMHAQQGILLKNMKIAVILHGKATKSALSNFSYKTLYKTNNPNSELIEALKNAHVEVFVCGQSFMASKYDAKDKSENVKMALSALTALVEYQKNGYQIINFN